MCNSIMDAQQPALSQSKKELTLAQLLSKRQWVILDDLLTGTPRSEIFIDDPTLPHAIGPDIVLHFAVRFQAPLRIISLLSRVYPESLTSADITGRYPIHVAAKWSATPDVIAYLIKTNPPAAGVPDSTGKTPMTYVGEFYLQHFHSDFYHPDDSQLQVVRLLKTAAPRSANLEDNEGKNAIEYALESDASIKVIKTMQRACRDDWRERSKSSSVVQDNADKTPDSVSRPRPQLGRRRHNDLVMEMEVMALRLQRDMSNRSLVDRKISGGNRIHVHQRRSGAITHAARTA